MEEAAATRGDQSTDTKSVIIQPELDPQATCPDEPDRREPKINLNQGEFCKALEIIERDSLTIAGSFTSLSLHFVSFSPRLLRGRAEDEDEKNDDEDLAEADEEESDLYACYLFDDIPQ
ncbi:hypothetical protein OIU84_012342 [Salix udensis]|uniref:Uncharacterized protein n=1 Tax=Salix udensis TaxID=889485 RepID=A0AAD6JG59_9ROSI|nr:hypothetical protein OIU84_012342 [Salix udensis]